MQERKEWEAAFSKIYVAPVFQVLYTYGKFDGSFLVDKADIVPGDADYDDRLVETSHERPEAR